VASDSLAPSLTRTLVPIVVGAAGGYASTYLHLTTDQQTALASALIGSGYYLAVRLLEHRWPSLGVLLGVPTPPTYPTSGVDPALQQQIATAVAAAVAQYLPAPTIPVPPPSPPPAGGTSWVDYGPARQRTVTRPEQAD
jgi:hypothetical protein